MCANELAIDEKELAKLPDGGELIRQLRNVIRQRDCQIQELRVQINELESDVAEKAKLLWKQKEEYEKKLEAAYTSIGELKDQINFMSSRRGVRLR
jgi:chromosome segregation ATPase